MPGDKSYGCCACIGASGVAVMPLSSVMLARDGVRINHLMNGKVTLDGLTLNVKTEYPYGERAEITVETAISEELAIGIRVPTFTDGVTVNGEAATPDALGYHTIDKVWQTGDVIEVVIPKKITVTELNGKLALTSGIIVLALDERCQDINVKLNEEIVKVEEFTPDFAAREAYLITFRGGVSARFVDFASAGADWANAKPNMTVWIDKE